MEINLHELEHLHRNTTRREKQNIFIIFGSHWKGKRENELSFFLPFFFFHFFFFFGSSLLLLLSFDLNCWTKFSPKALSYHFIFLLFVLHIFFDQKLNWINLYIRLKRSDIIYMNVLERWLALYHCVVFPIRSNGPSHPISVNITVECGVRDNPVAIPSSCNSFHRTIISRWLRILAGSYVKMWLWQWGWLSSHSQLNGGPYSSVLSSIQRPMHTMQK